MVLLEAAKMKKKHGSTPPYFYSPPPSIQLKRSSLKMAHMLAVMAHCVGYFVSTIWGLQERRFSSTFDAVSTAAVSVSITFVLCLFSITRSRRRGAMVFASF